MKLQQQVVWSNIFILIEYSFFLALWFFLLSNKIWNGCREGCYHFMMRNQRELNLVVLIIICKLLNQKVPFHPCKEKVIRRYILLQDNFALWFIAGILADLENWMPGQNVNSVWDFAREEFWNEVMMFICILVYVWQLSRSVSLQCLLVCVYDRKSVVSLKRGGSASHVRAFY